MFNCSHVLTQYTSCSTFISALRNVKSVGEGSTADVFRARLGGTTVALKVIPEIKVPATEIDISCNAGDIGIGPRIIGYIYCNYHPIDGYTDGRYLYMIMPYLPYTFNDALAQGDPLCILFQIIYDIGVLWSNGISHRDIHPENLFVNENFIEKRYQVGDHNYNIVCPHTIFIGDYGKAKRFNTLSMNKETDKTTRDIDAQLLIEFIRGVFSDYIDDTEILEYYLIRNDIPGALSSRIFESLREFDE